MQIKVFLFILNRNGTRIGNRLVAELDQFTCYLILGDGWQ